MALLILFRSVILPLKAIAMNTLSILASFGALVWIFQDGNLSAPLGFQPLGFVETTLPVILKRLTGRRVCGQCGKNYHQTNFRPKVEGVCDACGGKLTQRPDDVEETIVKRLKVYEDQTAPLIGYYEKKNILAEVSGDLDVAELNEVLEELFEKRLGHTSGSKNKR